MIVALDREEKGRGELSAIQEVERDFGVRVSAIVGFGDIIEYVRENRLLDDALYQKVLEYRSAYGISGK